MTLTVYPDVEQRSDEWYEQRRGVLTASAIGQLITPTLKVADNDTSRGLTLALAAERISGHVDPTYTNTDMWRGVIEEPIARDAYSTHHAPVHEVGFMLRESDGLRVGCSPDGLVHDDGMIEVKSRQQKKHVKTVLSDAPPPENMAQLQCALWVSGRKWIDYISFCGGMSLWVKRVHPIPAWQYAITAAAQAFEDRAARIITDYQTATAGLPMTERTPNYDDDMVI